MVLFFVYNLNINKWLSTACQNSDNLFISLISFLGVFCQVSSIKCDLNVFHTISPVLKLHSVYRIIIRLAGEDVVCSFWTKSCFPGHPWLKSARREHSPCARLITSPVTLLQGGRIWLHAPSWQSNWVFPPRLFQTLWITIPPLWMQNHSAHISRWCTSGANTVLNE